MLVGTDWRAVAPVKGDRSPLEAGSSREPTVLDPPEGTGPTVPGGQPRRPQCGPLTLRA